MSQQFVKDPRSLVKAGDIVKVKVMEVDVPRQRIGLSMRLHDEPGAKAKTRDKPSQQPPLDKNRVDRGGRQTTSKTTPQAGRMAAKLKAGGGKN